MASEYQQMLNPMTGEISSVILRHFDPRQKARLVRGGRGARHTMSPRFYSTGDSQW